jgi:hypothetical protein
VQQRLKSPEKTGGKGAGDSEIPGTVFAQFGGLSRPKYGLSILKHGFGRPEYILSTPKCGFSRNKYGLNRHEYRFTRPKYGFSRWFQ